MVQSGIDQLREQVRGAVITPDDEGYEQARRVYNAMIDRRPGAVVRCANAGDVVAAVNFAREHQLDLAVRRRSGHRPVGHAGGASGSRGRDGTSRRGRHLG
jgi:FAD/FMN-containing dehydrogenase